MSSILSNKLNLLFSFILMVAINTKAANINVTTLSDIVNAGDGVTSFREAITQANLAADSDIISFDGGLNGSIMFVAANGALILRSAATINGDNRISLDGSNTNQSILSIDDLVNGATINVTLSNLIIVNADSGTSAISSGENLTVLNCTFQNNGFGINMGSNPSNLTLVDSQFINHTQTAVDAKTVDVDNSQFTGNNHDAGQSSSLSTVFSATGGTIDDSTFTNNDISLRILGDSSAQFTIRNTNFNGNKKGILISSSGNVTISDSGFSANDSDNAVSNDPGAALQHIGLDGTLIITNSTFINNIAGQSSGSGGAIHIASIAGLLTVQSSIFTGNSAGSCGAISALAGALIENQTTIDNNTALSGFGGGACGSLTINNSVVSNNQANNNHGGGLSLFHPSIIKNSAIIGNTAGISSNGGGIIFLQNATGTDSFIINSTIANNTASQGGGVRVDTTPSNGRLTIINNTIVENTATAGNGAGIFHRIPAPFLTTVINNTIIANNTGNDIFSDFPLGLDLDGSNLIEDTSGLFGFPPRPSNVENLAPLLDPITNNGGFTQTYALMTDSPALGGGDNTLALDELGNALNFDQRGAGFQRIVFNNVDIGAYESNIPPTPGALNISAGPGNGPIVDPFASTQDVVAMHAMFDVSAQDAVVINSATFHVTGDGDDTTGITQVNLYLDQNGDGSIAASDPVLADPANFDADNGQVTFNINRTIAAGTTEFWILAFDLSDSACLCQDFKPTIGANDINADFNTGGVADVTGLVDGRFVEMAGGTLSIVSGNSQAGLAESDLASNMTVLSNNQFAACGPVRFSVLQSPANSEGQFTNQSSEIDQALDINNIAATGYTFGDKGGNYKIRAQYQTTRPFDCTTIPDFIDFDHSAAGITLTDTLMAYRASENNIRTFVQNIPAQDTFTVVLDPPMLTGFSLDQVNFNLAGQNMNDATAPFTATLDIQDVMASDQLVVTATITVPNGIQKTLQLKGSSQFVPNYPLSAIAIPDWFNSVEFIATGVTSEFFTAERKYSIGFEYPTDFVWTDAVDNVVALLGGAQSELGMDGFKFALTATYDLDSNSSLSAAIERDITLFNRNVTIFGEVSAGFDQNFDFNTPLEPVGTIGASTSIKLGEKSFARTVLVYGVPVTVALDLAGVASIAVVGRLYLNQQLEISQLLLSPEPTVQLNISASISALMGLAKAIASANPTAAAQIHLPYNTTNGLQAPKFGGRLTVELKVEGSLFFGLASAELGTAMLGPYTWGDFISKNLENKWAQLTAKQILIDNTSSFINTHAIAGDTAGNTMLVLTQDVGAVNPDAELYYQYDDGTGFSALAPLSGSAIANSSWEMDPAITLLNNGDTIAIWTNNSAPAATTSFDTIINAQEIYWSKWDALGLTWQNALALTNNTSADGSSDIDFNNSTNTAVAVWVHDTNPGNNTLIRTDWEIVSAIYNQGTNSWGPSIAVTSDSTADYMPAVATRGNTTMLVWSEDIDGELFVDPNLTVGNDGLIANGANLDVSNSDATLVYSTFNGATWSAKQILYNSVSGSSYTQMADITGYAINSFIAVWVDKQATVDVLYYAVYENGAWLPPVELLQSTEFIEDPSVTVNSSNIPTIVYRSYDDSTGDGNGYGGNLYSIDITLNRNNIVPNGATANTITDDKDAQLFSSTTLSNNRTVVAWFNRSSTGNDGILMTNNSTNTSTIIAGCTEQLFDDDSNQLFDRLELTLSANIALAGEYILNADLYDSRDQFVINTQSPSMQLTIGANNITLTILGSDIRAHGVDGIHVLKNISLSYSDPAATVVDQLPIACSTSNLTTNDFELAPLFFDKDIYHARAMAKVSLKKLSENLNNTVIENVSIRLWSNLDTAGISLTLTETGVDTGIFESILSLDDISSNEINSQILAPFGSALVARYDDGNSSQSLIAQATVITPDIIFSSSFETF